MSDRKLTKKKNSGCLTAVFCVEINEKPYKSNGTWNYISRACFSNHASTAPSLSVQVREVLYQAAALITS